MNGGVLDDNAHIKAMTMLMKEEAELHVIDYKTLYTGA